MILDELSCYRIGVRMESYIQKIHDHSWREVKTDYSFYQNEKRFDILKDILLSRPFGTILDAGCGSGYLAYLIKAENPQRPELLIEVYKDESDYQGLPR